MKRFYKEAATLADAGGWPITLDGRPVRTPKRAPLLLPTEALAAAIVGEWNAQGETVAPRTMPMTGLANAAIDHVGADRAGFSAKLAAFAETDLVCYRAEEPPELASLQMSAWDPLVEWAARRHGCRLQVTSGIRHIGQDAGSLARLRAALDAMSDFQLAAMQPLVTIAGSLVIGLALVDGAIDPGAAFDAAHIDELYQAEKWGDDSEARTAREARRDAFAAAARFLTLLLNSPK